MRLSSRAALAAAAFALLACNRPAERDATAALDTGTANSSGTAQPGGGASNATAAAAPKAASPTAAVVVLYNYPKDTAAFEKYYTETHMPIVHRSAQDIGASRAFFEKFDRTADGKKPAFYRKAELWFDSEDAMKRGMESAGFKAVAGDLPNFSTGGQVVILAHETHNQ
jgi:uncharacterized protein (TIGR02118 family)